MPTPPGAGIEVDDDPCLSLSSHASTLYDDLRLMPMLRQLVRTSCQLTHSLGGSISLVDQDAGRYTKIAEMGMACRLGQSFSLDEGLTGRVVRRREPVALTTYEDIARGHLAMGHPAREGSVVAVPIWWRDEIVAVNVVFAGAARPFSLPQIDHLELVTQVAAPGLVTAIRRELPPRVRRPVPARAPATLVRVADVVEGLIGLADRAPWESASTLEVAVVRDAGSASLIMRTDPDTQGPDEERTWHELRDGEDGTLSVHQADAPHRASDDKAPDGPCLLSARESQVVRLVAQGLSDRAMADLLTLSRKTVEKHVGAVLRKTGTSTRTAAVVRSLELGWL